MIEQNQPLISLVYVSSAAHLFSDDEPVELLNKSVVRNQQENISGMLLYKDGNFMQVIEGPEDKVMRLYGRISQDPRHNNILMLLKQTIPARQFAAWEMAFVNLNCYSEDALPGYSSFLSNGLLADAFRQNSQRAYTLLLSFRDTLR